jgi:exonuclease III
VSSCISNKRCGTAIFIKDTYKVTQVSRDDEGRFVQAIVDFDGDKLSFVSLYAPNKNPERNSFFSSISEMIDLTRPTFVCGDFNSVG